MPQRDYTGYIASDQELLQIVDSALAAAAQRAGAHLACYPGCAVCCFAPFPITISDADRLRAGFTAFSANKPNIANAIAQRAESARACLSAAFPGNPATGVLDPKVDEAAFAGQFSDLACPVLDPDSGRCLLYESRPIACRTYGLPTCIDGENLPSCPLCFRRASSEDIETARAVIDLTNWPVPSNPGANPASSPDSPLTSMFASSLRTVIAYAIPARAES